MTVYVDDVFIPATVGRHTSRWCHLFSDRNDAELHELARQIGLRRSYFQDTNKQGKPIKLQSHRHYDVTEGMRQKAIRAGAIEIPWREAAELSCREAERLRQQQQV
jgi:hypothetical protein